MAKKLKKQKKTQAPEPPLETGPVPSHLLPPATRADVVTTGMVVMFMRKYLAARAEDLLGKIADDTLMRGESGVVVRACKHDAGLLTAFALAVAARERASTLATAEAALRHSLGNSPGLAHAWERVVRTVKHERGPLAALDSKGGLDD